jgi:hypothetical protein
MNAFIKLLEDNLTRNLSPKAVRFIVEALEFRIAAYQRQLSDEELDEDESADIGNDLMFLKSLLQSLQQASQQSTSQVF